MKAIIEQALNESRTYNEYRELHKGLVAEGKTSGPNQTDALIHYTKLNDARMRRWEKRYQPDMDFSVYNPKESEVWLLISETWCGDAAQILPVINKIAEQLTNVELRLVLRDEHPGLMDNFLTNGARSIPKLIRLRRKDFEVLSTWGARPKAAQPIVDEYKASEAITPAMFQETLAKWYVEDNGKSVEEDFALMLK